MNNFTSIFIKRPVLASVISLLILLFGIKSLLSLQVRQFPRMDNAVITVMTAYPGADAALVAGFITTPIEGAIASAEGIDYMTSQSVQGMSTITLNIKLNFDTQVAFTDVMSKVQQTLNKLPPQAQRPIIIKKSDTATPLMYISLNSNDMTPQQITDYAMRVVQPSIQTIDGIATAELLGGQTYALRAFLNPVKMAALEVTPEDVYRVLGNNNFLTAAGNTKAEYIAINVKASTNVSTLEAFKRLIVKSEKNSIVRLEDVAKVELGSESYDTSVSFDGQKAVFLAITPTPSANPLTVISAVRKAFPSIREQFPPALDGMIVYDATDFIRASIKEVMITLTEAVLIVIGVIYLFLGSLRAVLVPVVTIPLSLIGVCTLMLFLGYSLNLLTLLAFVLAIGLVVDDAIVVVENIHRHIEEGLSPWQAAILGAKEISLPVIAMTITLAAVYAPIGFMEGLTGALFKEFAFTLASSVIISGIIALTLSPMMCSKILTQNMVASGFTKKLDNFFENLKLRYRNFLHQILDNRVAILILIALIIISLPYLYSHTAKETAPEEDQGFFFVVGTAPQIATLDYIEAYTEPLNTLYKSFKEMEHYFIINAKPPVSGMVLKPWDKRSTSQFALKERFQKGLDSIAGLKFFGLIPPPLPGGGEGTPVEFVIKTTTDYATLEKITAELMKAAQNSGLFIYLDKTLNFNQPQVNIEINRAVASELGLDMQDIGSNLASALSGGYVNYFDLKGRSYQVIPQLLRPYRYYVEQLNQIYLKTKSGQMVPLSTVVTINEKTEPNALTHFQQMNSATIQGVMMPGTTLGQALEFLQVKSHELLPKGFDIDYSGQSRQFIQEGSSLIYAFFLSVIVIFLVLSAQYESFRDPLIILISVPMSICGALIPLNLGLATINIYTQVGLITLIGLISKHGILIVDFANHLQKQEGLNKREAVEKAASIRLRPILMTTSAMVFGVMPLLLANGAGAVSRFNIGLVIAMGLLIGSLFTLFVVPTLYTYLAKSHNLEEKPPIHED